MTKKKRRRKDATVKNIIVIIVLENDEFPTISNRQVRGGPITCLNFSFIFFHHYKRLTRWEGWTASAIIYLLLTSQTPFFYSSILRVYFSIIRGESGREEGLRTNPEKIANINV